MQSNLYERRKIKRGLNELGKSRETRHLPRARLLGGDVLNGGTPCAPGHAGRRGVSWIHQAHQWNTIRMRRDAQLILLAALLAVTQLLSLFVHVPITALAASGNDPMTITFDGGTRHQLDGQEAYCCDPELTSPPEGTVLTHWKSGSLALDYVVYHAQGGPQMWWSWLETRYVVWAVVTGDTGHLDYYADGSVMDDDFSGRCHDFYNRALTYQASGGGGVEQGCSRIYAAPSYEYQSIVVCVPQYGQLTLTKTSALEDITRDSSCYSLAGAVYTVYSDEGCANVATTLTTDKDGNAESALLYKGTYWVKETTPPQGYACDEAIYRVEVTPSSTTNVAAGGKTPSDTPLFARIATLVQKSDSMLASKDLDHQAQGDATLAGAQFTLYRYDNTAGSTEGEAVRTWTIATDSSGSCTLDDDHIISGDEPYRDIAGVVVLPLGTYVIRETNAPEGYHLNTSASYLFTVTQEGSEAVVTTLEGTTCGATDENTSFVVEEDVVRGGVCLGKIDAQREDHVPQGAATLSGAVFAIELTSPQPVVVNNVVYETGSVVSTITTDEAGIASTNSDTLPYGSYVAYEVEAPEGYNLTTREDWSASFEIREDGVIVDLSNEDSSVPDQVKRGDLSFVKVDGQSMRRLAGIPFVIESLTTGERHVIVTDENGYCSTEAAFIAHTYHTNGNDILLEDPGFEGTPASDDETNVAGSVDDSHAEEQAEEAPTTPGDEERADNPPIPERDDISQNVVAPGQEGVDQNMAVPSQEDIDQSTTAPSPEDSNHNDVAIEQNGNTNSTDTALGEETAPNNQVSDLDTNAGIWFSGETDANVDVTDEMGALPYDWYRVSELRTPANEGFELVTFDVRISRDSYVVDGGTVDDNPSPAIHTQLAIRGGSGNRNLLLDDIVWFGNLTPDGSEYELKGTLHLVNEDGSDAGILVDADGNEASTSVTFVPTLSYGTTAVTFSINAAEISGRRVVAFEELWKDGALLAQHSDIQSEEQTIVVPSIQTTLTDERDHKEVCGAGSITLVDNVRYEGLVPNKAYQLEGVLMDKETGEALYNADGTPVVARTTFVPNNADGTAQVTFVFDGFNHRGRTIVAFESLLQDDIELVTHADLEDENQTVVIPCITTTATDACDGDHVLLAEEAAQIVDHVSFSGLTPGATYLLKGHLVDRKTGKSIADDSTSSISMLQFSPNTSSGVIDLTITVDAYALAGREITVYEQLERDGNVVATHEDPTSDEQSLAIPRIGTTATSTDGSKRILAENNQAIVDSVSYQKLIPGRKYLVKGELHIRNAKGSDLGPLRDARGNTITTSATFIPEKEDGTVKVSFLVDATQLADSTLVAFEEVIDVETGSLVASHRDITDKGQSVDVTKPSGDKPKSEEKTRMPQTGERLIPYGLMVAMACLAIVAGAYLRNNEKEHIEMR